MRATWVRIWNSVFRRTQSESEAFKQANGRVNTLTASAEGWVTEASGRFRAVLIREGVSKNGNKWTRDVLKQVAKLANGVAVRLFDMSEGGDKTFLSHWATLRRKLPPAIQKFLPTQIKDANVGVVADARFRVVNGRGQVEAEIEAPEAASGLLSNLIKRAARVGSSLGLSIHIDEGGLDGVPTDEGGIEPTEITSIAGFDVVSFPSAGGQFLPVLEAWAEGEEVKMNFVELLLRLLEAAGKKRETVLEEFEGLPSGGVTEVSVLCEEHSEFVEYALEALEIEHEESNRPLILEALSKIPGGVELEGWNEKKPTKDSPERKKMKDAAAASKPKRTRRKPKKEGDDDGGGKKVRRSATEAVTRHEFDAVNDNLSELLFRNSKSMLEATIKSANLPKPLAKFCRNHFVEMLEADGVLDDEMVESFVVGLKSGIGGAESSTTKTKDRPMGTSVTWSSGEKALVALEAMVGNQEYGHLGDGDSKVKIPAFRGLKQAYGVITGDTYCEGVDFYDQSPSERNPGVWNDIDWDSIDMYKRYQARRRGMGVAEAMDTTSFPLILSNLMHKFMLKEYKMLDFTWQLVARGMSVSDFKQQNFHRVGEFGNLSTVAEGTAYLDNLGTPSEERITLTIEKKGGIAILTWEMLVNDDLDRLRTFPAKMARAAMRTLNDEVFTHMTGNGNIYDATALAAAGHNNFVGTAYSFDNLKTLRRLIHLQDDLDNQEPFRVVPRKVVVGPDLYDQVYEDMVSDGLPTLAGTDTNAAVGTPTTSTIDSERKPNVLRTKYGLSLHEVHEFGTGAAASADDYWMTADPGEVDMIVVGFLNGRQDPELFVQDLERVGSFFDTDEVTWKIRHVYKSVVVDYRPFAAGIS